MLRNFLRKSKIFQLRKKAQDLVNKKNNEIEDKKQHGYYSEEANKFKEKLLL